LGDNIKPVKKNTEILIDANKVVLEVSTEQTEYKLMSLRQNSAENHNISNRVFEKVAKFNIENNTNKSKFDPRAN
jgi:hypothetical protein